MKAMANKIKQLFLLNCVFLVFLLAVSALYFRYLTVDVVLYSAITAGLIASTIFFLFVTVIGCLRSWQMLEKVQLLVNFLLISYVFAISGPTVIDRSLSFYILEKLQQRGGAIQLDSFENIFKNEYVVEHRLINVRITEQLESGTITLEGGCVRLTTFGNYLASFSRWVRAEFLPRQRLLMGEYTDELTNVLGHSGQINNYSCRGH